MNDPPFLNLPSKGESIIHRDPTNIVFQWTPRHMMDPNLAFNTEYEFSMVELWDNGVAPEGAFLSNQPFYRTTTRTSTLLYGAMEPLLTPGRRYAWRVRVQSADGSMKSSFRNHGYSEVYWFHYQKDCPAPLNVQAEPMSEAARITWTPVLANTNSTDGTYKVDFRERKSSSSDWYSVKASSNRLTLHPLQPDRTYEYRVGRSCDDDLTYVYSDIKQFTTNAIQPQGECEASSEPTQAVINREPIQTLHVGDVITSGGGRTRTRIVQVSGRGKFTGWGYATMSLTKNAQFKVKFSNIVVNTDKQLIGGFIESVSSVDDNEVPTEKQITDLDQLLTDLRAFGNKLSNLQSKLEDPINHQQDIASHAEGFSSDIENLLSKISDLSSEEKAAILHQAKELQKHTLLAATGDSEGVRQAMYQAGQAAQALSKLEDRLRAKAAAKPLEDWNFCPCVGILDDCRTIREELNKIRDAHQKKKNYKFSKGDIPISGSLGIEDICYDLTLHYQTVQQDMYQLATESYELAEAETSRGGKVLGFRFSNEGDEAPLFIAIDEDNEELAAKKLFALEQYLFGADKPSINSKVKDQSKWKETMMTKLTSLKKYFLGDGAMKIKEVTKSNEQKTEEEKDEPEDNTQKIAKALSTMQAMAEQHIPYKQETSPRSLRTDETPEALEFMDCSEFVSRYLKELGLFDKVPDFTTDVMAAKEFKRDYIDKLRFIKESKVEGKGNSFIPQAGDIFLWRRSPEDRPPNGDGHTGIVLSYDTKSDVVEVMEALGSAGSADNSRNKESCVSCVRVSKYYRVGGALTQHLGWQGYFRPVF